MSEEDIESKKKRCKEDKFIRAVVFAAVVEIAMELNVTLGSAREGIENVLLQEL